MPASTSLERLGQVAACRLPCAVIEAVLIVDAALVADHAFVIEHEGLGRALGPEAVGDDVALIAQHGKGQLLLLGMLGHVLEAVLLIGIDGQEGDALGRNSLCSSASRSKYRLLIGHCVPRKTTATAFLSFKWASDTARPDVSFNVKSVMFLLASER